MLGYALNMLAACLLAWLNDVQGALAFYIVANIWQTAYIYGSKRDAS